MRRKSQSTTSQPQQQQQNHQVLTPPVEGITASCPPANLNRAQLQRKLQPKQNMRKDPGMKRDLSLSQGVCYTAVNITDPAPLATQADRSGQHRENRRLSGSVCDPLRGSSKTFPTTQSTRQIRSALPPYCLPPVTRHTHS
ncbi:hypothetical protein ElyMa_004011500 [Elysia marginata]|uniref:Uncharacterized protein n=1 Tax=Elysia marginata TaxID=1093978 RepID=A0AAV4G1U6_9GAST|nr:hypothetical protein ElyMa_004011500 [Elysia marginata]